MKYLTLFIFLSLSFSTFAQLDLGFIRDGNASYEEKNYTNSEESYRRALEVNTDNFKGLFNLGNSIYQQGRYEEAVKHFEAATSFAPDDPKRAQALHNLGNAHLKLQDYENSVKSYIESLKINPSDQDTKYNLAYAMQKLKEQQQQQEQQEKSDCDNGEEGEDGEEKEQEEKEEKEQEEKESEEKDQENKDKKGQDGEEKKEEQQKDQKKGDEEQENEDAEDKKIENPEQGEPSDSTLMMKKEMSMEEVLKILEIMDNEEQKVQQKLRAPKGDRKKTDKDW